MARLSGLIDEEQCAGVDSREESKNSGLGHREGRSPGPAAECSSKRLSATGERARDAGSKGRHDGSFEGGHGSGRRKDGNRRRRRASHEDCKYTTTAGRRKIRASELQRRRMARTAVKAALLQRRIETSGPGSPARCHGGLAWCYTGVWFDAFGCKHLAPGDMHLG